MHVLGEEALEQKEEDFVATRPSDWCSRWHSAGCRGGSSRHNHRVAVLGRQEGGCKIVLIVLFCKLIGKFVCFIEI